MLRRTLACLALAAAAALAAVPVAGQTDLDAFMQQVLAKRDDNWKKLQQYVLDEREQVALTGPLHTPLWGERREYAWFIRDGFFVRSPVKVDGVTIGEAERRKYETDYLKRQQELDRRRGRGPTTTTGPAQPSPADADAPKDVDAILRQARQPEFISSAYFLRFRFEEGKYALVGHDTLNGHDTLRVEYYPAQLFRGDTRRPNRGDRSNAGNATEEQMRRMMNKVALITLWVEPASHQIIKYTFNNVAFDFLPAQWLARVDDIHASMTMSEAFPEVWLPQNLVVAASMTIAIGQYDFQYTVDYHDYRRADVTSKVGIPAAR